MPSGVSVTSHAHTVVRADGQGPRPVDVTERTPSRGESGQYLGHAVKGECAVIQGDRAARELGIGAVDRRLVSLTPRPERQRRRCREKRVALDVGAGIVQRLHQGGVTLAEPVKQVLIPRFRQVILVGRWVVIKTIAHYRGRPPMNAAAMHDQVTHCPLWTRWDRGIGTGRIGGIRQSDAVLFEVGNVLGDLHAVIVPIATRVRR